MKAGKFIDARAGAHGLLFGGGISKVHSTLIISSLYQARKAIWEKTIMAYRDEIDDGFDAVVFLEER